MELLFLLYAFNYLKEVDSKNQSLISHNKHNAKKREKMLTEENEQLKERLDKINLELTKHNMQELVHVATSATSEDADSNKP